MPRLTSFVLASIFLLACNAKDGDEAAKAQAEPASAPVAGSSAPIEPAAESAAEGGAAESAAKDDAGDDAASETGDESEPAAPLPDSFEKLGIEECDAYVEDYSKCIAEKMADAEREAARRAVFENLESWKQTAEGGPSAQKGLQTACRIAREQAKRATQDLGCDW